MEHFNWDCACKNCLTMKAAPDLYEALKNLQNFYKRNKMGELPALVEQALAKAEDK
ncbi:hypothetical protein LCGC14_0385030 [marine sediment metagenome]|uniref:Uncharacterized protein n=1 Tax=marine sediment metagenome TaxID=412755 RepID=A0A0F9VNE1_9ZZZZ